MRGGKKKLRVLLNACMYTSKPNGNGIYIREVYNLLCKKLDSEDIGYTCYAYNANNLLNKTNVKLITIPFSSKNSFNKLLGFHRIFWNTFILPFIALRYDLVFSFSNHGSPFVKNQIITIHDLICLQFPHQNRLQYFYNKYVLPYIINSCKQIVTISDYTRGEVVKHFNVHFSKISVIHNGGNHFGGAVSPIPITQKKYLSRLTGDRKFFLSVGATYPHKNLEPIIEAFSQIDDEYVLIITGQQNKYFQQLKYLIQRTKAQNVILLDYVDSVLLSYLYSKCTANVYLSLNEGFGFPPMEAAFYNKISIISNCGALPEIYGGAAYYANPCDVDEIKKALLHVASPQFSADEYQKQYSQLLSIYTWQNTASKIADTIVNAFSVKKEHLNKIGQFG